ncbi:hypothetical protein EDB86DRAFT_2072026 [Lactarius hatsudake]|nr:hypothetical protein EDB86DRAFT_2072026 [Lactarius hatsudake]
MIYCTRQKLSSSRTVSPIDVRMTPTVLTFLERKIASSSCQPPKYKPLWTHRHNMRRARRLSAVPNRTPASYNCMAQRRCNTSLTERENETTGYFPFEIVFIYLCALLATAVADRRRRVTQARTRLSSGAGGVEMGTSVTVGRYGRLGFVSVARRRYDHHCGRHCWGTPGLTAACCQKERGTGPSRDISAAWDGKSVEMAISYCMSHTPSESPPSNAQLRSSRFAKKFVSVVLLYVQGLEL